MVKLTFTSVAVEGYQGFAGEQELSFGNAFAGAADKAAYDREMWNALHAASILGDEATMPSNIANAQLRMTAASSEMGSKKKGGADKGLSVQQMIMLQNLHNLISDIDGQIADIQNDINFLESINDNDAIITTASYDDLSEHNQARLDQFLEIVGITKEEYEALSIVERIELRDETLEARYNDRDTMVDAKLQLQDLIADARDANMEVLIEPLPVTNGRFDNEYIEAAVQQWEDENQREFDRYNVNVEELTQISFAISDDLTLQNTNEIEIVSEISETPTEVASYIDQGTTGMTFKL